MNTSVSKPVVRPVYLGRSGVASERINRQSVRVLFALGCAYAVLYGVMHAAQLADKL